MNDNQENVLPHDLSCDQGLVLAGMGAANYPKPVTYTLVPGYLKYSVSNDDRFYVFEMPFEGLFGYLPYVYNWIIWFGVASIFKISIQFNTDIALVAGYMI